MNWISGFLCIRLTTVSDIQLNGKHFTVKNVSGTFLPTWLIFCVCFRFNFTLLDDYGGENADCFSQLADLLNCWNNQIISLSKYFSYWLSTGVVTVHTDPRKILKTEPWLLQTCFFFFKRYHSVLCKTAELNEYVRVNITFL